LEISPFQWIEEPKAIFESRYPLFVLSDAGIKQTSIYAPRRQELEQLQGIPLAVTLAFETRDAISPRLRSTVAWAGKGVVYVLTQVIGRSIGLVVRGVFKALGIPCRTHGLAKMANEESEISSAPRLMIVSVLYSTQISANLRRKSLPHD
jgi:hypothetical protein